MLQANVGTIDRAVRAMLGAILVLLPLLGGMTLAGSAVLGVIAIVAGVVLLASAALRVCFLYRLIGVSTCPIDRA